MECCVPLKLSLSLREAAGVFLPRREIPNEVFMEWNATACNSNSSVIYLTGLCLSRKLDCSIWLLVHLSWCSSIGLLYLGHSASYLSNIKNIWLRYHCLLTLLWPSKRQVNVWARIFHAVFILHRTFTTTKKLWFWCLVLRREYFVWGRC